MQLQIIGRCGQNALTDTDLLRDIRRVRQCSRNDDGNIELILKKVGHALRQYEINRHTGIVCPITQNGLSHEMARQARVVLPDYYLRIHLTSAPGEVRELADRLHGLDVSPATIGYAFVEDGAVVGFVPQNAAGTLLHELFHLLVRSNFGDIPQWLDEGIASLYEVSGRRGDEYFGLDNWRRKVLDSQWQCAQRWPN